MRILSDLELELVAGGVLDPSCECELPPDEEEEESKKGNNGWGNGEDAAPGRSASSRVGAKFVDPGTGASPSKSPRSRNGDR
jgi:hypothetical protein